MDYTIHGADDMFLLFMADIYTFLDYVTVKKRPTKAVISVFLKCFKSTKSFDR